ncbi:MAG: hypothetical protein FWF46_06780 [Oscillospiraceae bacterium]|nr:hypothetical protein [Oscillospiraceae bacterium]
MEYLDIVDEENNLTGETDKADLLKYSASRLYSINLGVYFIIFSEKIYSPTVCYYNAVNVTSPTTNNEIFVTIIFSKRFIEFIKGKFSTLIIHSRGLDSF